MEVKWTKISKEDLDNIQKYIFNDNPKAAKIVSLYIIKRVETLLSFKPSVGRTGKILGTRELIIGKYPYIVIYRVKDNEINILRVLHTSRKWE